MKIFTENAVYVQKNDMAYLNTIDLAIPASIYLKVYGNGDITNNKNRYEFIYFDDPEEILFFRSLDWMIDYDDVKDLSDEETMCLGQRIIKERDDIARIFNSMVPLERERNMDMVLQCELLEFKFYSLRDILFFKQGKIEMKLPEEAYTTHSLKSSFKENGKTIFNKNKTF